MTPRENLIAVLDGKRPQWIPLTINHEFTTTDDPAWNKMFELGLGLIPCACTYRQTQSNVEREEKPVLREGKQVRQLRLRTPVGEIQQISCNGWIQEYFLKTPADYRVMEYIVRHTRLEADYHHFMDMERQVGDRGIVLIYAGRSPMQTILVDYAGVEMFSYHITEEFPELFALAEALNDNLLLKCKLIAGGPGRYVSLLENFTAEIWGAERFARYHCPVYAQILPILRAGGKIIFPHMDGKMACVAHLFAQTAFDGIESLTPPPEGDMSYEKARDIWPDKIIWGNLNVSLYNLPPDELSKKVKQLAREAAPDGSHFAFEISEDCPANWRHSIPAVLNALADIHH